MPNKATHEVVKVIGGIAWLVGLILLFVNAPLGVLVLLIALILSILSLVWTRRRLTDSNGSSPEERPSPVSWLAVGVGYAVAATLFVLRLVGSDLPLTGELAGTVALTAVAAVPPTLALAGLTGRSVLLLPAGLAAVTPIVTSGAVSGFSVLGAPMALLGIIWFWSYLKVTPGGRVAWKAATTLAVWLLWVASAVVLFIHTDPRCVETLTDGVVSGECVSDIVTGWEALASLALAAGAATTGWLMTKGEGDGYTPRHPLPRDT